MFDRAFYNNKMNNYASQVDHLVNTMKPQSEGPFNTEAYANYKAQVDKEREKIDPNNLTESIYKLGYRIDTLLSKLIRQLDTIIEEENDNKEVEITVNPLTHKVTYNKELNVYNVVEREDKK